MFKRIGLALAAATLALTVTTVPAHAGVLPPHQERVVSLHTIGCSAISVQQTRVLLGTHWTHWRIQRILGAAAPTC